MALRFIDGFDHKIVGANITRKWTSADGTSYLTSVAGRNAGGFALFGNTAAKHISKTLDDQATWVVGLAVKCGTFTTSPRPLISFRDSANTVQASVVIGTDGTVKLYRGTNDGTLLATSTYALPVGGWVYLEAKVYIHDTSGTFEARVNAVPVVTYSGDTKASSTISTARTIRIFSGSTFETLYTIDDLYICDGTGSTNNDFLGDVRIDTLLPDGAGNYTQFTPTGSANNWENVDEVPPDDDTSYNASDTVGHKDSFTFSDLSALDATIYGVQTNLIARKDDAGERSVRALIRSSSTDATGSTQTVGDTYSDKLDIFETDPVATSAWTESSVNATEFGYEVVA